MASYDAASNVCQALGLGAIPSPGTGSGMRLDVGMGGEGTAGVAGTAPKASQQLFNLCNAMPPSPAPPSAVVGVGGVSSGHVPPSAGGRPALLTPGGRAWQILPATSYDAI